LKKKYLCAQDDLYKFVLKGKKKYCNIISDGKLVTYEEHGGFNPFDESPTTYVIDYKPNTLTAKSIYDFDFG